MTSCNFREIDGDLFTASDSYSLAHCVAADLKMGKGIAVKFKNKFGQIAELQKQNVAPGGIAVLQNQGRFVYYLITKESSWGKPTYQTLHSSLTAMRDHMVKNNIQKLAMPRIGCGLDGLSWLKVSAMIKEVFMKDNVEIIIYNYGPSKR